MQRPAKTVQAVPCLALLLASCAACRKPGPQPPVFHIDRITVSETTLAGNPSLDLDTEGFRKALIASFENSKRFHPVAAGEKPPAGSKAFHCRAEVAFTRESEDTASDAAGIRAEVGIRIELSRSAGGDFRRHDASALGRTSFSADDLSRRRPAFRDALDHALSAALDALLLELEAGEKPEPALLADLASSDPRIRDFAVRALADRKSPAAVPALIERLSDPDPEVALRTVGALRSIGDRRAVPPLIEFTRNRDPAVILPVIETLGALGGDEAEAYLFTLESGHPDEPIRDAAKEALADLRRRREAAPKRGGGSRITQETRQDDPK